MCLNGVQPYLLGNVFNCFEMMFNMFTAEWMNYICFQLAVKRERSEARKMKKAMKELYRSETQQAQKVAAISGPSAIRLM